MRHFIFENFTVLADNTTFCHLYITIGAIKTFCARTTHHHGKMNLFSIIWSIILRYHHLLILLATSYNQSYRSSRQQIFFKTGVLKNFSIFTGKQLYWSLFLRTDVYRTPLAAASDHNLKQIPEMSLTALSNYIFVIFKLGIIAHTNYTL